MHQELHSTASLCEWVRWRGKSKGEQRKISRKSELDEKFGKFLCPFFSPQKSYLLSIAFTIIKYRREKRKEKKNARRIREGEEVNNVRQQHYMVRGLHHQVLIFYVNNIFPSTPTVCTVFIHFQWRYYSSTMCDLWYFVT